MKKCPICSKDIADKNLYCPVCESHLEKYSKKKTNGCSGCLVGCLVALVFFIIAAVLGGFIFKEKVWPRLKVYVSHTTGVEKSDLPQEYQEFFSDLESMMNSEEFNPQDLSRMLQEFMKRFEGMMNEREQSPPEAFNF